VRAAVKPKKVRKEKKANADDPEKAKRREAVMQKWAERKAGEAASARNADPASEQVDPPTRHAPFIHRFGTLVAALDCSW
jgi:hypothetical protein